jgi:hypothetical protein
MPYLLSLSTTSPSLPTSYRKLRERNHEIMTLGSSDPSSDSDSDSNLAHNVASSRDSHSVSQQLPTTTTRELLAARERARRRTFILAVGATARVFRNKTARRRFIQKALRSRCLERRVGAHWAILHLLEGVENMGCVDEETQKEVTSMERLARKARRFSFRRRSTGESVDGDDVDGVGTAGGMGQEMDTKRQGQKSKMSLDWRIFSSRGPTARKMWLENQERRYGVKSHTVVEASGGHTIAGRQGWNPDLEPIPLSEQPVKYITNRSRYKRGGRGGADAWWREYEGDGGIKTCSSGCKSAKHRIEGRPRVGDKIQLGNQTPMARSEFQTLVHECLLVRSQSKERERKDNSESAQGGETKQLAPGMSTGLPTSIDPSKSSHTPNIERAKGIRGLFTTMIKNPYSSKDGNSKIPVPKPFQSRDKEAEVDMAKNNPTPTTPRQKAHTYPPSRGKERNHNPTLPQNNSHTYPLSRGKEKSYTPLPQEWMSRDSNPFQKPSPATTTTTRDLSRNVERDERTKAKTEEANKWLARNKVDSYVPTSSSKRKIHSNIVAYKTEPLDTRRPSTGTACSEGDRRDLPLAQASSAPATIPSTSSSSSSSSSAPASALNASSLPPTSSSHMPDLHIFSRPLSPSVSALLGRLDRDTERVRSGGLGELAGGDIVVGTEESWEELRERCGRRLDEVAEVAAREVRERLRREREE